MTSIPDVPSLKLRVEQLRVEANVKRIKVSLQSNLLFIFIIIIINI